MSSSPRAILVHVPYNFLIMYFVSFKSAAGWDYQAQLAQHESQTDAKKGFGGKYGLQTDRQDKVHL